MYICLSQRNFLYIVTVSVLINSILSTIIKHIVLINFCNDDIDGSQTFSPPDICPPMKNGICGHLPPKQLTGEDNCPPQQMHNGGYLPPLKKTRGPEGPEALT